MKKGGIRVMSAGGPVIVDSCFVCGGPPAQVRRLIGGAVVSLSGEIKV